ncbi:MAG: mucoidy inhibitor MuiA family protein [Pseudomonadota bacterium]
MGRKHLLCTLMLLPALAGADDLQPSGNRINSVTVFPDRAEVTRRLELDLPAGDHTVLVPNLPAQLFQDSLRAGGEGPEGLSIAAVEIRREFGEKAAAEEERKLREQLQALNDEKDQLNGRREALDTRAKFIEQLANPPSEQDKNANRTFTPEKWETAWQMIGKGMEETNLARLELKQQQRELDEMIRKVEQELRQIQTGRRDTITAAIQVEASQSGKASFDLTYQLGGASWSPIYDASLLTESGKLELTQAAYIRQNTGENWQQAQLVVSTARPGAGASMPELHPWWIDFLQPPVPLSRDTRIQHEESAADQKLRGVLEAEPFAAPAETKQTRLIAGDFSVRYAIPGRVSVPADNSNHRFILEQQQLDVSLTARTAPKLDTRAFLYAELDYTGEAPLLPGTWRLQRDGVFVGKQDNEALRPGETIALAFGEDNAIAVDYKLLRDERSEQGLISREKNVQRRYRITVTNHHSRKLPVSVFDQLPVARDEEIKVALSDDSTPPSRRDVEDRAGILEWKQELAPNQEWRIDFGYNVSYPKDKQVPGF